LATLHIVINSLRAREGAREVIQALKDVQGESRATQQALQGGGAGGQPSRQMKELAQETGGATRALEGLNERIEELTGHAKKSSQETEGLAERLAKLSTEDKIGAFGDLKDMFEQTATTLFGMNKQTAEAAVKVADLAEKGAMVGALAGPWGALAGGALGALLGGLDQADTLLSTQSRHLKAISDAQKKVNEEAAAFNRELSSIKGNDLSGMQKRLEMVAREMTRINSESQGAAGNVAALVSRTVALAAIKEGDLSKVVELLYAGSIDALKVLNEAQYGKSLESEFEEASAAVKKTEKDLSEFFEKQDTRKKGEKTFGQTSLTEEQAKEEIETLTRLQAEADKAAARYTRAKSAMEASDTKATEQAETLIEAFEKALQVTEKMDSGSNFAAYLAAGGDAAAYFADNIAVADDEIEALAKHWNAGITGTLAGLDREIEKQKELAGVQKDSAEARAVELYYRYLEQAQREKEEPLTEEEIAQLREKVLLLGHLQAGYAAQTRALEEAGKEQAKIAKQKSPFEQMIEENNRLAENLQTVGVSAIDSFADHLTEALFEGTTDWKEFVSQIERDLVKLLIKFAVIKGLELAFGAATGGIGGAALGLVLHDGGEVGRDGTPRAVPAALFSSARRYHSGGFPGLRPDEVPAILQKGERVLSRREVAQGGGGGTKNITIDARMTVVTPDADSFRSSERQTNRKRERALRQALLEA
jgi:hypothetical protein